MKKLEIKGKKSRERERNRNKPHTQQNKMNRQWRKILGIGFFFLGENGDTIVKCWPERHVGKVNED